MTTGFDVKMYRDITRIADSLEKIVEKLDKLEIATISQQRLDALQREIDDDYELITRQGDLLTGVANALKGPPGPLMMHDHADLPKVAEQVMEQLKEATHDGDGPQH